MIASGLFSIGLSLDVGGFSARVGGLELRKDIDELLLAYVEHVVRRGGRMLPFGRLSGGTEFYCVVGTSDLN